MRGNRKLDRRVRPATLGQHPQNAPDGIAVAARLLGDLDHGEVAVARRPRGLARHDHTLADAPVVGSHEPDATLEREAPCDLPGAPLEHFDDGALGAAAIVAPRDARRRAVAVEHHAHLAVRQEQVVALALVRHQEAKAVAVAAHGADDHGQAVHQAIFVRAVHQQLAVARHGAEALGERLALLRVADAEQRGERIEAERLRSLRQLREQHFAARDRFFVALRLLAKARVFLLPSWPAGHRVPQKLTSNGCLRKLTRPHRGPPVATCAQVAELVDALGSGLSAERRGGSSPLLGTILLAPAL